MPHLPYHGDQHVNIILFNGPPGCGKDTAAMHIHRKRHELPGSVGFDRLSMPNKRAFAGMTNTTHCINQFGINRIWEPIKDVPKAELNGKSYRQWQIDFSEKFMKPLYGEDIFAQLFASRIIHRTPDNYTYVVPDCGFVVESNTIRRLFPQCGLYFVRIYRDQTNFSKDSRSYLSDDQLGGWTVWNIMNYDTIDVFEDMIFAKVREWLA